MSITGDKLLKIPTYGGWTTHCWINNNHRRNQNMDTNKWKHDKPKLMGFSKSSAKREVHSNTSLPQETRETSNKQLNFTPKATWKRRKEEPQS